MKRTSIILVAISACLVCGILAWLAFRPPQKRSKAEIYSRMAVSIGVDKEFWKRVGVVLSKATSSANEPLSPEDYSLLYQALDTGKSGAQAPALMALSRRPPTDKNECFRRVNLVITTTDDPEIHSWALGTLWNLFPDKHSYLINEALNSKFPRKGEEMKTWPEVVENY